MPARHGFRGGEKQKRDLKSPFGKTESESIVSVNCEPQMWAKV